jgi:hypothetical protein
MCSVYIFSTQFGYLCLASKVTNVRNHNFHYLRPMKALFALTLCLLMTLLVAAQNTSSDEYNYILKGMKGVFQNGRSVKKGYYLSEEITFPSFENKANLMFVNLMRKDHSHAGTVAALRSFSESKTYYVAIPALDSTGNADLETTVLTVKNYKWKVELSNFFFIGLADYLKQPIAKTGCP